MKESSLKPSPLKKEGSKRKEQMKVQFAQSDDNLQLNHGITKTKSSNPGAFKKPALMKVPKITKTVMSKTLTKHVVTRWYRAPEVILMN